MFIGFFILLLIRELIRYDDGSYDISNQTAAGAGKQYSRQTDQCRIAAHIFSNATANAADHTVRCGFVKTFHVKPLS